MVGNATCLPFYDLQPGTMHSFMLLACYYHTEPRESQQL